MLNRISSALAERYLVERELGTGGMATVYLAEDLKLRRKVAIKVLREHLAMSIAASRFLREIRIAAQLQHPNILPLLDSGEAQGILYYVMPYVEGESLRQRLERQGELPVDEAVRILTEVVDALAYAHSRGVVHRDIKPDNVMLSGRHALVADFGVARAVNEATGQQTITSVGVALGTPAYMSPEQATADPHVDHRTDIYAVGALAYELFTGRPPFTGHSPQQVLSAHLTEQPEPVTRRRPALSPELEQVIMKCLSKRPADRWQSGEELLAHLEPLATLRAGTSPISAPTPATSAARSVRGKRVALVALVAVALWQVARFVRDGMLSSGAPIGIGSASQFTAEDGLEIHPSISPDGRLVAYAAGTPMQMRIYLRPVTGGRTIAVSERAHEVEFQPRWSPDGQHILYMTHNGVFIVSALGGTGRQIAARVDSAFYSSSTAIVGLTAAAWAPDGKHVLVGQGGELSVVPIDGGIPRKLGAWPYEIHSCDWSPVSEWIACVSGNAEFVVPVATFGNIAPSAIVLVRASDGELVEVTDRSALHQSPVWSADGRRLYFVSNQQGPSDIYVIEVSNGKPKGSPQRITTGLGAHTIAFSSDGARLVYSVYQSRANIRSLPIPTGSPVDATTSTAVTSGNQTIEALRVSPDGEWLMFDSNLYGSADIFRIPVNGGAVERLTSDPADEFAPSLSPDGREFAYHSWRTGTRDIFVRAVSGGPEVQVTNTPAQESFPVWSPDGNALAYQDQTAEGAEHVGFMLVRRDASGKWGTPERRRSGTSRLMWSPDGSFIAYSRFGAVEVMSSYSGEPRVVYAPTPNTNDPVARDVLVSDDGRTLYFKSIDGDGRAAIWSLPVSGGRPQLLVTFGDLSRPSSRPDFAAGAGRFFFTLEERESDIWVADIVAR